MEYLVSIVIGILSSLVASILFLFAVSRIKPNVEISKFIAKSTNANGRNTYKIKVANRGRRPIINIHAQLHMVTPTNVPGGTVQVVVEVKLIEGSPLEIPGFYRKDKEATYTYRFTTNENLESIWRDDVHSHLRFRMFATDSLSGFGKVFRQDYYTKRTTLQEGHFEFGDSFKIV